MMQSEVNFSRSTQICTSLHKIHTVSIR